MAGRRDGRLSEGSAIDAITGSFLAELFGKHRNSTQAESQHLCAAMTAVVELIEGQGLQITPTAVFAAVMATLNEAEPPEAAVSSPKPLIPCF